MAIPLILPLLLLASAPSSAPAQGVALRGVHRGVVGVCVRWGADPRHVAEAVVAVHSGNATIDGAVPEAVRAMDWPVPRNYRGQWAGYWVTVGGAQNLPVSDSYPACSQLPDPPARTAS
jgi:hypothetical protein